MAHPVAQTMFDIPGSPINSAVQATPHPSIPNLVVAFPSPLDWRHVYDPHNLRGPRLNRETYENMKRSHEHSVMTLLGQLLTRTTGKVVLAQIQARPSFSVLIFPFDFLPMGNGWQPHVGAVTTNTDGPASRPTFLGGNGTGSSVDIYYSASRHAGHADDALLHELVHATRFQQGVLFVTRGVTQGYGNLEEFIATVVADVYLSEKKAHLYDYLYRPLDPDKFLDDPRIVPSPRLSLGQFRSSQPSFFAALANIGPAVASFNPMRQFTAEYQKLVNKTNGN